MELLQWKEDIHDEAELLTPLSKVLQQLLASPRQAEPSSRAKQSEHAAMDVSEDEDADEDEQDDLTVQATSR